MTMEAKQVQSISAATAKKLEGIVDRLMAAKGVRHAAGCCLRRWNCTITFGFALSPITPG